MGWFYRFELKAIQGFIFAGRRLREVVGASALIELLSDGGLREIAAQYNGTVRYRAAGGATLHFNDKIGLEGFAARWPMEVATFAPGVVLTQAWVEDSTPQPISALARKLGAHRNLAPPAMPSATPVIERSPYGALATNKANDEGQFIDQATRAKEIAQAKSWNPKHPTLADELSRRFVGDDEARLAKLPRELTEITGHDGYYLAVIHADGNDVGRLVQGMGGDIETMAAFSEKLSHATEAAARTASLKHLFDDDSAYALGRPIVVGGDDITAVVRADRALPFLETYCAAFAEETRSAGLNNGKGLTASAGVAFVRAGHPFRDGYRLAEGLCEHAKKVGRGEEGEGSPALVAFHRVSASLAGDISEAIGEQRVGEGTAHRSMGPYIVGPGQFRGLVSLSAMRAFGQSLRKLPRGSIREMLRILQERPAAAAQHFERFKQINAQSWNQVQEKLIPIDHRFGSEIWVTRQQGNKETKTTAWFDAHTISVIEGRAKNS